MDLRLALMGLELKNQVSFISNFLLNRFYYEIAQSFYSLLFRKLLIEGESSYHCLIFYSILFLI